MDIYSVQTNAATGKMKVGILCGRQPGKFGWLAGNIYNYLSTNKDEKNFQIIHLFGDFLNQKIWAEIKEKNFDCLINAVGYRGKNSIQDCEKGVGQEKSRQSNLMVVQKAVDFCRSRNIKLIQISTACVFDGYQKNNLIQGLTEKVETYKIISLTKEFTEGDVACRDKFGEYVGTMYGRHKWQAEEYIRRNYYWNSVILRPHLPFNSDKNIANIIHRMNNFKAVYDEKQSMTYVPDLCKFIDMCLADLDYFSGQVFNVVNAPPISMADIDAYRTVYLAEADKLEVVADLKNKAIILDNKKIYQHINLTEMGMAMMNTFSAYAKEK